MPTRPAEPKPWDAPRSAYVHVPFCLTACAYCDFAITTGQRNRIPEYVDAVIAEIHAGAADDPERCVPLETAYLGGGTPSLLSPPDIKRILNALRSARGGLGPDREVTIEANPGTFVCADVEAWLEAGVTRVSLGVQSLDDATLRHLGRTHDAAVAWRAVAIARDAGIGSLNLDLMYGLPWQTLDAWVDHLRHALDLAPEHLSLYALAVEDGTPLARHVASGRWSIPDDDLVADMYEAALPIVASAGLVHDEVSNWARPGHESRHNRTYWRNDAYIGVGPAAHQYIGGRRSWNVRSLDAYLARRREVASPESGHETLSEEAAVGETAILALRIRHEGIDFARFRDRFEIDPRDRWPRTLHEAASHGLLEIDDRRACLTDAGLLLSNEVGRRLLAEVSPS
jgi:oxygen-independent coproporphyrinogen-3 oxidase